MKHTDHVYKKRSEEGYHYKYPDAINIDKMELLPYFKDDTT